MSLLLNLFKLCCFASIACFALGATKNKRHGHNGTLEVYDGKLISFKVTPEQEIRLDKGEPVSLAQVICFFFQHFKRHNRIRLHLTKEVGSLGEVLSFKT